MTAAARQDGEPDRHDPSGPLPAAPRGAAADPTDVAASDPTAPLATTAPAAPAGSGTGVRSRRTVRALWGAAALAQVAAVALLIGTSHGEVAAAPRAAAVPAESAQATSAPAAGAPVAGAPAATVPADDIPAVPPADAAPGVGQLPVGAGPPVPSAAAPPIALMIPALKIDTRLLGVRKDRQGRMQVPEDPQRAAWYSQGPAPGDPGPAVLVGHVDSYTGPGIFVGLSKLRKDDRIDVRRADGTTVGFRVQAVETYSKREFPTDLVYRGDGQQSLRLITCGGSFDRKAKSYRDNVVVFATPEPAPAPRSAASSSPRSTSLPATSASGERS